MTQSDSITEREVMRVGVVGAGGMGTNHLQRLSKYDDVVLQSLAEVDEFRRENAGNRFGFNRTFDTLEDMLHEGGLDCVFILTSDWLHHRMTTTCLQAGLPVFVEKPPGILIEETEDIVRVARETGKTLVVGFNRRFTWHQVLSRLEEPVQLCIARWLRSTYESPWTIINGTIHAIDVLACTGGEPERIIVEGDFDPARKETVVANIVFAGGGRGVLISRYGGQGFNTEDYEAHGANTYVSLRRRNQAHVEHVGEKEPEAFTTVGDSLELEHRHFLECVRGNEEPLFPLECLLYTMRIAEEIHKQTGLVHPVNALRPDQGWMIQCAYCGGALKPHIRICTDCGKDLGGWTLPVDDEYLESVRQIVASREGNSGESGR